MRSYRSSTYRSQLSPRGRAGAAGLAAVVVVALLIALMRLGVMPKVFGEGDNRPLSFDFLPAERQTPAAAKRQERQPQPRTERAAVSPERRAAPQTKMDLTEPAVVWPEGFIRMSRADFAGSDVGKIARAAGPAAGEAAGGDGDAGPPTAPGSGPRGEPLYYAEWYREPTRAEMSPYMPRVEQGWGMIACKTADRYRVEDCQELGETPGSGIARGLRQAAFQFLVRPPRKGNKPMIGAWVRIRFDLTRGVEK